MPQKDALIEGLLVEWEVELDGFRRLLGDARQAREHGRRHILADRASEAYLLFLDDRIDAIGAELRDLHEGSTFQADVERHLFHLRALIGAVLGAPTTEPPHA